MNHLYLLYLIVLACGSLTGLIRYKHLDKASRILLLWLGITFLTEVVAYYTAMVYRNNIMVYAVANIIQVVLLCIYFNFSIPGQERKKTGYFWAIVSLIAGIVNLVFFQTPNQLGTYFLIYTGLLVIAYCLFGFSRFLASPVFARFSPGYPRTRTFGFWSS